MFKRVLVILILAVVVLIGVGEGFALDATKNLEKETKSEPHFDLPKEDAKEQCEEVERVVKDFYIEESDYECGQINTSASELGIKNLFYCDNFNNKNNFFTIIYNYTNRPVGILLSNSKKFIYRSGYLYSDDFKHYNISNLKPAKYNFLLEFNQCQIKQLIINQ